MRARRYDRGENNRKHFSLDSAQNLSKVGRLFLDVDRPIRQSFYKKKSNPTENVR